MRASRLALMLVLLLALGLPLLAAAWRWSERRAGVVEVRARMPQAGGWSPADIRIPAGEDLHLRLTSDDVMHSFAIGQSSLPAIDLYPGKTVETTLRFDQPGKYTYYCTRWCGADHWRMRGTIEVTGPGEYQPVAPEQPLFVTLGLDIDAPHPAAVLPAERPSAARGAAAGVDLPGRISHPGLLPYPQPGASLAGFAPGSRDPHVGRPAGLGSGGVDMAAERPAFRRRNCPGALRP